MSLQGPIVVVAEQPVEGLVRAFTAAGAFPIVEARWADAAGAVASVKPAAVVLAEPDAPDQAAAQKFAQRIAESETYLPVVARVHDVAEVRQADEQDAEGRCGHGEDAGARAPESTIAGR